MTDENIEDYEATEPGSFTPQSVSDLLNYTEDDDIQGLDENFKLIDEQTYSSEIENLRKIQSDADALFKKRDAAIEKYKEAVKLNESNEHKRIIKLRLLTLNYYINRLIITYFKKSEEEQTTIDEYYQKWLDTASIKVDLETLKQYVDSPFNDMACLFASVGIMFTSDMVSQNFCVPKGPTTDCAAADITDFQSPCFNTYTGLDDKGEEPNDTIGGYPQHLAWGEKDKSQAKCSAGLVGFGRQERGVCGLGYYKGEGPEDTFNHTRCHAITDDADGTGGWADIGNLNNTCAIEVGGNLLQGIDSTANFYTTNGPPDLQYGASKIEKCGWGNAGQKAKCQLGYYYKNKDDITQIQEGMSHCTQPADLSNVNENADMICRKQVGFGQESINIDQPSQHTYGFKEMYEQGAFGCYGLKRRLQCETGYSRGVKLDPWSSECVYRTDNMGGVCKNTYGKEWFPWPQKRVLGNKDVHNQQQEQELLVEMII